MTRLDDLVTVIDLACETESRSDAEQRALLRVARWVDGHRNANVTTNKAAWGPRAGDISAVRVRPQSMLESTARCTRVLDTGDKVVALKARSGRPQPDDAA